MRFTTSAVAALAASLSTISSVAAQGYLQEQYSSSGSANDLGGAQPNQQSSQGRQYGGSSFGSEQRTSPPVQRKLSNSIAQEGPQDGGLAHGSHAQQGGSSPRAKYQGNVQSQGANSYGGSQWGQAPTDGSPMPPSLQSHQAQPVAFKSEPSNTKPHEKSKAKGLLPGLEKLGIGVKKQSPMRDTTLLGIPLGDKPKSKAEKAQQTASRKDADKNSDASLIDAVGALFQNFRDPQEFKAGLRKAFSSRAAKDSLSSSHFKQSYTMNGGDPAKDPTKKEEEKGRKATRSLRKRSLLSELLDEDDPSILDARGLELQTRFAEADPSADAEPEAAADEFDYDAQLFGRGTLMARDAFPSAFADPEACASPYGCAEAPASSFDSPVNPSLGRRDDYLARKELLKREIISMLMQRRYASEEGDEPKKKAKDDSEEADDPGSEGDRPETGKQHSGEPKTAKEEGSRKEDKSAKGSKSGEEGKKDGDGQKAPEGHPDVCDACKKTGLPQSLCKMVKICQ